MSSPAKPARPPAGRPLGLPGAALAVAALASASLGLLAPGARAAGTAAGESPAASVPSPASMRTAAQAGDRSAAGQRDDEPPQSQRGKTVALSPDEYAAAKDPSKLAGTGRRTILVTPNELRLLVGSTVVFQHPFTATAAYPATLAGLADLVAHSPRPRWLREVAPRTYLLRAAITQTPRSALAITTSGVNQLRMLRATGVYLSGWQATLRLSEVTVTSWDPGTDRPDTDATSARPFVTYAGRGARLVVTHCNVGYLGNDASPHAYGLAWGPGSVGKITDSDVAHNFFGIYSNRAHDVVIRRNRVHDNVIYGIDPHTGSHHLTVEGNDAFDNGSQGIVFSKGVTHSTVTDNRSHDNRRDGIIMDARSDHNLIAHNDVRGNGGGGIVAHTSADVTIRANTIVGNDDGVRVNGSGADGVRVVDNTLRHNHRGIQVYETAAGTRLTGNTIQDSATEGILLDSPQTTGSGNRIHGADTGVELRAAASLDGLAVTGAKDGVQVKSPGSALHHLEIAARKIGIRLDDSASVVGASVTGARRGVDVTGGQPRLSHLTVVAANRGIELATPATVDGLTVRRSEVGVRALPGSSGTRLSRLRLRTRQIGIESAARLRVAHASVAGPTRGVKVMGSRTAVRATSITAHKVGVLAESGGTIRLRGVSVDAVKPVRGRGVVFVANVNTQAPPPVLTWLEVAGAVVIVLAVSLHLLQRRRRQRVGRGRSRATLRPS